MDRDSWHCTGGRDQDHPPKKGAQKVKWLFEEALQVAEKRREAKGKGEKEKYTHLMQSSKEQQGEIRKLSSVINAKKQRKTTECKRQDLKKIRDTKGIFHVKMGTIKDRNDIDRRRY